MPYLESHSKAPTLRDSTYFCVLLAVARLSASYGYIWFWRLKGPIIVFFLNFIVEIADW
jgi:hypothetical protein